MNSKIIHTIKYYSASFIVLICCVLFQEIPSLSANEENKTVHYVAIDIDDIFQPNWDSELHQVGTVKMDGTDVESLIKLTYDLRSFFGEEFSFSIGYNSGYYDSTNTGDKAFIKNASYFYWFNHFPFHQHIVQYLYTYEQIEKLILEGKNFENSHGLNDFTCSYLVTPLHEGLWYPYEPIYDIFEKYEIYYSSTPMVDRPVTYGNVKLIPRYSIGIGSGDYSLEQISEAKISSYAITAFNVIMNKETVIFYTHQANFAKDRLANRLIYKLTELLKEQDEYRIVFLPAEEVVKKAHELQSPLPDKHEDYFVYPPYPNPFNQTVMIRYEVPIDCKINLTIYNISGRVVKEFRDLNVNVGIHEIVWDAKDDNGELLSSSVYIYSINTKYFKKQGKMMFLK